MGTTTQNWSRAQQFADELTLFRFLAPPDKFFQLTVETQKHHRYTSEETTRAVGVFLARCDWEPSTYLAVKHLLDSTTVPSPALAILREAVDRNPIVGGATGKIAAAHPTHQRSEQAYDEWANVSALYVYAAEQGALPTHSLPRRYHRGTRFHELLCDIARNGRTAPYLLRYLAASRSATVRSFVARNEGTPSDVTEELSYDALEEVRFSAVRSGKLSVGRLAELARDCSTDVRGEVARQAVLVVGHEQETGRILKILAEDDDAACRIAVADAADFERFEHLAVLAADKNSTVQILVAGNPTVTEDILVSLARTSSSRVRREILRHPRATWKVFAAVAAGE